MKELEKFGDLLENVSFKTLTSYKIGKTAKNVLFPSDIDNLVEAIKYLKENNIQFFILGSGSNIIIPDKDYEGVVIKLNNLNNLKYKGNFVIVGAGYYLPKLVKETINEGLAGLEWALGIPSSVGGAVVGNAGAYLSSFFDFIRTVTILDENLEIKVLNKEDIIYSYRHTSFKDNKKIIVLEVLLELSRGNYESSMALVEDRTKRRVESQPLEYPSAGSVFRNPEGMFAGKLIEDLGIKGHIIGGAQVSEKHANFIINIGNATGEDIKKLIFYIKDKVKERYDVDLFLEQEFVDW